MKLAKVTAMGHAGRDALLSLARRGERNRMCAVGYLIELREPRALPMLRRALADDEAEPWLVGKALWGVGAFGAKAFATDDVRDPVGRIIQLLQHGDPTVSQSAAAALGTVRDERAVGALCDVLLGARGVLFHVLRAIGSLHQERGAACVEELAARADLDDIERGAIASTLATVGSPRGRAAALEQLRRIGDAGERARTILVLRNVLVEAKARASDSGDIADIERTLEALERLEAGDR